MAAKSKAAAPKADLRRKLFIGGRFVESTAETYWEVTDPTTNEVIAQAPLCTKGDVDRAVQAAAKAFPAWRDTPPPKRAGIFFKMQQIMLREAADLARIISREHGKVMEDAGGSVRRGIDMVEHAAGIPTLLMGRTVENVSAEMDCDSWRCPLGVCACIAPFNFPMMVPMWFGPIAMACGNTFIVKPSEKTPLCSLRMAELWKEAGLPDGVFNVITGARETVDALLYHPEIKAISSVGSTPVARYIYATASAQGKRVQALAGAKNHLVAMPDADIPRTVAALLSSAYGSAGERCMAVSVLVTVGDVAEPLMAALLDASRQLKVGPGADPASEMGPLVTRDHLARVTGYIDLGVKEGARLLLDGRGCKVAGYPNGNWLGPTIFDGVDPKMRIYKEEIFGPVLCVVRVKTLEEAIDLINANNFGNGTAIFTDSGLAARKFRHRVNVGMIGINVPIPVPMAFFPFTGWKDSFFGTLHAHGQDGVNFFTEAKIVTTRWFGAGDPAKKKMGI